MSKVSAGYAVLLSIILTIFSDYVTSCRMDFHLVQGFRLNTTTLQVVNINIKLSKIKCEERCRGTPSCVATNVQRLPNGRARCELLGEQEGVWITDVDTTVMCKKLTFSILINKLSE